MTRRSTPFSHRAVMRLAAAPSVGRRDAAAAHPAGCPAAGSAAVAPQRAAPCRPALGACARGASSGSGWAPTASWPRWADIERYFAQVAAASDRVELVSLGTTTEGQRLPRPRSSARPSTWRVSRRSGGTTCRLADPRALAADEAARRSSTASPRCVVDRRQHPRDRDRRDAGSQRAALRAGDEHRAPRCSTALRSLVIILDAVAESRRPPAGRRLVRAEPRHAVRERRRCRGSITSTRDTTSIATRSC